MRMERETGIEPATNGLGSRDSTTELLPPGSRSAILPELFRVESEAGLEALLEFLHPEKNVLVKSKKSRQDNRGGRLISVAQVRMRLNTSFNREVISLWVVASRFKRSKGSVFERRTLKCQLGYSTETPSI